MTKIKNNFISFREYCLEIYRIYHTPILLELMEIVSDPDCEEKDLLEIGDKLFRSSRLNSKHLTTKDIMLECTDMVKMAHYTAGALCHAASGRELDLGDLSKILRLVCGATTPYPGRPTHFYKTEYSYKSLWINGPTSVEVCEPICK